MPSEIDSTKMSQVLAELKTTEGPEVVQTPTEAPSECSDVDFLAESVAADPESFNVCISCD